MVCFQFPYVLEFEHTKPEFEARTHIRENSWSWSFWIRVFSFCKFFPALPIYLQISLFYFSLQLRLQSIVYIHHIFLAVDGHTSWFNFLTSMTRASMNRSISVVIYRDSGYMPRSCIAGSCGRSVSGFLRSLVLVSKVVVLVYINSTHRVFQIKFSQKL